MGQCLYQLEILLEEGHWKILDLQVENVPKEAHIFKRPPYYEEGNILGKIVKIVMPTEDHIGNGDSLKEEDIQARVENHPIEGGIQTGIEGLLEEEDILEEDH